MNLSRRNLLLGAAAVAVAPALPAPFSDAAVDRVIGVDLGSDDVTAAVTMRRDPSGVLIVENIQRWDAAFFREYLREVESDMIAFGSNKTLFIDGNRNG